MLKKRADFAPQQQFTGQTRSGRVTWGHTRNPRKAGSGGLKGKSLQQQMNEEAVMKERAKIERERERRASEPPKVVPTDTEVGNAQGDRVVAKKARIADAETQRLRNKFSGNGGIPLVTPAANYVANRLIDKGFNEAGIYGTLGGLTVAPLAAGTLLYQNHKTKEAEKEKQEQAQAHRDKVAEVIAKRNLLLEQRQAQAQQPTQPRVPYNFFSAAPLVTPANFAFPKIGVRNPFYIKKEKALPLTAIAGTAVAGYGLLSKLNKQRALDAYKVNSLKDKNAQDFAANYFDSPQYHADNLIREAANITGNPLLQGITDNPLDRLTPSQQQAKTKGTARYSRGRDKVANFFDPLITPALALGSTAYGIYNKKKAADEQSEVFEAQKLAALDGIKDKQLRRGLLNKAQNRFIDDDSKNRIIDSALNGDIKSVLRTGLKRANWEALQ